MVLVWEEQQPALHALTLQGGEGGEPLNVGHSVVECAMGHEHGRAPARDVVGRVELLVDPRRRIVRATVLPLREPQLFGAVVHGALVEDARMVDDAAKAIRPVAGDPVLHEAAVGRSERTGALAIEPVVLVDGRLESFLQIDEGLATPVLADRIGECLAVAGRTVEIDEHHTVTCAGVNLCVPAPGPLIRKADLRSAVHDEGDRIFLTRLVAVRLHHMPVDRRIVPALERKLFELAEAAPFEAIRVDGGQATQRLRGIAGASLEQVQIGRRVERGPFDHHAVAGRTERGDLAATQARRTPAGGRVDFEQRHLTDVVTARQQSPTVEGSAEGGYGAIPVGGQRTHAPIGRAAQHDLEAIRFEARARHGEPRQIAIGQEHGLCIPGRIVGGQVARCARTIGRYVVEIEVRRPGFAAVGETRTEHEPSAVRAECIVLIAAEGFRGHITPHGGRDVDGSARATICAECRAEQHRQRAVLPSVPMSHEQLVVALPGRFLCALRSEPIGGAFQFGTVREDLE